MILLGYDWDIRLHMLVVSGAVQLSEGAELAGTSDVKMTSRFNGDSVRIVR